MKQNDDAALREIVGGLECPKDFKCYREGHENLCKAQDVGLHTFLECLEEHPDECSFSISLDGVIYRKCPLRVYISKKLSV